MDLAKIVAGVDLCQYLSRYIKMNLFAIQPTQSSFLEWMDQYELYLKSLECKKSILLINREEAKGFLKQNFRARMNKRAE